MLLRIVVAIGMTAYCIIEGAAAVSVPSAAGRNYLPVVYLATPILLWAGLNPRGLITWPVASILLLASGHWTIGWVPIGLVAVNVVGNEMIRRHAPAAVPDASDNMTNVMNNFVRYCKSFLVHRCGLSEEAAEFVVLDPELGPPMDQAKRDWAWQELDPGEDPDTYLLEPRFDAPQMRRINELLERFAAEYEDRLPRILEYLRSIGHPMGSLDSRR